MRIILVNFSFSFSFFLFPILYKNYFRRTILLSNSNRRWFQRNSSSIFEREASPSRESEDEKTNFSFTVLQVRCGKNTTLCLHSFGLLVSSRNEEKISPAWWNPSRQSSCHLMHTADSFFPLASMSNRCAFFPRGGRQFFAQSWTSNWHLRAAVVACVCT